MNIQPISLEEKAKLLAAANENEYEQIVSGQIALPTDSEWAFYKGTPEKVVTIMNDRLLLTLDRMKASGVMPLKHLREMMEFAEQTNKEYDCGIEDSEGLAAMALFFALNYDPALFKLVRYGEIQSMRNLLEFHGF